MLVHRTICITKQSGAVNNKVHVKWAASGAAAGKQRAMMRHLDDYIPSSVESERIQISTKKDDLIELLNNIQRVEDDD